MRKDLNRQFTKGQIQMANKCIKSHLASLIRRGVKSKTTMSSLLNEALILSRIMLGSKG